MAFQNVNILIAVIPVFILGHVLTFSAERKSIMVRTFFSIDCNYEDSLARKVFYIFLSWDPDNALAYLFREVLIRNTETEVYMRARREGFNVERVREMQKLRLSIQKVQMSLQNLSIVCLVKDDDGRGAVLWKREFLLDVIGETDPPHIFQFRRSVINVTLGGTSHVELFCSAGGHPPPRVRWWKRSPLQLLHPQIFDPTLITARHILSTPFKNEQDGYYLCEAITDHAYMKSLQLNQVYRDLRVNVQYAPKFRDKEMTIYADIDQVLRISILVSGNPIPLVHCSPLPVTAPKPLPYESPRSSNHHHYSVYLLRVQEHHLNDFPCFATNSLGDDTSLIRIRVGPSKPKITSPAVSRYSDYLPLWWTSLSGSRLRNVTVQVTRRQPNGVFTVVRTQVTPIADYIWHRYTPANQTFLAHITNLSSNMAYAVRIRTCNRYNCSLFSEFHLFRTSSYDGTNAVNPQVFMRHQHRLQTTTTLRPRNIRLVKRCRIHGYPCSTSSMSPQLWLSLGLLTTFRLSQ